jgi:hypothetical protein
MCTPVLNACEVKPEAAPSRANNMAVRKEMR